MNGRTATNKIPSPNIADAVAVTDGRVVAGYIVKFDGSFFSYGSDHILIGEYGTRAAALASIPKANKQED
jgi:hypothetical protein